MSGRALWIGVIACGVLWIGLHTITMLSTQQQRASSVEREAALADLRHRIWELEITLNTVKDFDKDTARQQRTAKAASRQRSFALAQRAVVNASLSPAQLDQIVRHLQHPAPAQAQLLSKAFDDDSATLSAQFKEEKRMLRHLIRVATSNHHAVDADPPPDDEIAQLKRVFTHKT